MPTPTSGVLYVSGGFGIVEFPGGVATLRDGCDYDDGDVIISGGIVRAFDPSGFSGGIWVSSGYTGIGPALAGFEATTNDAVYFGFGGGIYVDTFAGGVYPLKVNHQTIALNLEWESSGHTSDPSTIAAFDASGLAHALTLPLAASEGGTGQSSYTLGDIIYSSASNTLSKLAGQTTEYRKYLRQTGTGSVSAAPAWDIVKTSDLCGALRVCGRLTLESGVPFSTTNQTAKTTVYWVPYAGNTVPIYDSTAGDFINRSSTGCDVAVPSTLFRLYDIFGYWTGSVVDLETTNWTQTTASVSAWNAGTQTFTTSAAHGFSVGDYVGFASITGTVGTDSTYGVNGRVFKILATASSTTLTLEGSNLGSLAYTSGGTIYRVPTSRATALDTVNGVLVKASDHTRTYLGTGMTWGTSGQTEQSISGTDCKLLLWNKYNQLPTVAATYMYASHSYTATSWRFWNNNPANTIWSVSGEPTSAFALLACDGQGGEGYTAIGFDSVTGNNNPFKNNNVYQVAGGVPGIWSRQYPGLNGIRAVEFGATGWASTYASLQLYQNM